MIVQAPFGRKTIIPDFFLKGKIPGIPSQPAPDSGCGHPTLPKLILHPDPSGFPHPISQFPAFSLHLELLPGHATPSVLQKLLGGSPVRIPGSELSLPLRETTRDESRSCPEQGFWDGDSDNPAPSAGPDHGGYGPVCTRQPRDESPSPPESHKSQISSFTPTSGLQDLHGVQGNLISPANFVAVTHPGLLNKPVAWIQGIHAPNHREKSWTGLPLPHFPTGAVNPTLVMGREVELRQLQRRKVATEPQKKLSLGWFGSS